MAGAGGGGGEVGGRDVDLYRKPGDRGHKASKFSIYSECALNLPLIKLPYVETCNIWRFVSGCKKIELTAKWKLSFHSSAAILTDIRRFISPLTTQTSIHSNRAVAIDRTPAYFKSFTQLPESMRDPSDLQKHKLYGRSEAQSAGNGTWLRSIEQSTAN